MKMKIRLVTKLVPILLMISVMAGGKTFAGVELPVSPINAPVGLLYGDEFDTESKKTGDNKTTEVRPFEKGTKKISKAKAVVLSLLVPGAGQFYADAGGRGEIFMGAEAAIWIGYFAFHSYGNWKEDDYINYATRNAGIDPSGKDDEFYRNLVFYNSREEYNRSGRIIDPSSPYYAPNSGYDWYWTGTDSRMIYRNIRNQSETAFRKATFMLGMAVFNRILSGIDAFRVAQKKSREINDDILWGKENIDIDLKGNPFGSNPHIGLEVSRRF